MKQIYLQTIISISAIALIITHIILPTLAIDAITLGLIVIAIIPWLAPLFKSLQLPGGVKIEYQDLEKTEKQIKDAGLLPKKITLITKKYDFLPTPDDDPNIVLAWLRIEIEKRLRTLARDNRLPGDIGIRKNMLTLYDNNIINDDEKNALADLIEILSSAVHGVRVDPSAAEWAIEVGPLLLKGLDNKLKKK